MRAGVTHRFVVSSGGWHATHRWQERRWMPRIRPGCCRQILGWIRICLEGRWRFCREMRIVSASRGCAQQWKMKPLPGLLGLFGTWTFQPSFCLCPWPSAWLACSRLDDCLAHLWLRRGEEWRMNCRSWQFYWRQYCALGKIRRGQDCRAWLAMFFVRVRGSR